MSSLEQRLEWRRVDSITAGWRLHAIAGRRFGSPGTITSVSRPRGESRYMILLARGTVIPNLRPGTLVLIEYPESETEGP